jgi:hypothetical protein
MDILQGLFKAYMLAWGAFPFELWVVMSILGGFVYFLLLDNWEHTTYLDGIEDKDEIENRERAKVTFWFLKYVEIAGTALLLYTLYCFKAKLIGYFSLEPLIISYIVISVWFIFFMLINTVICGSIITFGWFILLMVRKRAEFWRKLEKVGSGIFNKYITMNKVIARGITEMGWRKFFGDFRYHYKDQRILFYYYTQESEVEENEDSPKG